MNNDRRTFLDGSIAPRKPLPAPLTEGAMKAAMEDWLTALPKPAVKEFFGVAKKFFNPKDKKKADAKNLEILKKYKIKPLINDPSHRESLNALSCCLDMLMGGQGQMPWESVEVDGDSIEEVKKGGKIVKKEKPKKTKDGKKPYFMDYPNKYEEVTTEAKNYAKMSDKSIVSAEMQTILSLAMQTLQGAMGEQDMTDVRYTKRVGIEINSERHEQLMLALEREVKKGGSKLQMWGRKKGQGVG